MNCVLPIIPSFASFLGIHNTGFVTQSSYAILFTSDVTSFSPQARHYLIYEANSFIHFPFPDRLNSNSFVTFTSDYFLWWRSIIHCTNLPPVCCIWLIFLFTVQDTHNTIIILPYFLLFFFFVIVFAYFFLFLSIKNNTFLLTRSFLLLLFIYLFSFRSIFLSY